ncbi:hypothetical protein [Streptomyces oceani]|nr:hypothetical protein [Streptomyces oceani]
MPSNARKVLAHAQDLVEQPNVTLRELSFATRMLAAGLKDVLYLVPFAE